MTDFSTPGWRSPEDQAGYRPEPRPPVDMSATSTGFDFVAEEFPPAAGPVAPPPAGPPYAAPPPSPAAGRWRGSRARGGLERGRATVVGQVRGLQSRSEYYGEHSGANLLVFRIERYDEAGNRLRPVPVQLRAIGFDGALGEGDEVEVTGRWKDGTLHTDRVHNLTTGASVSGKPVKKALLVFLALVAALVVVFAVLVIRNTNAFQDDVNQHQQEFCEEARQRGNAPIGC
jgi:hypothetical protein